MTRQLALATAAADSAPISAPAPKQAEMIPNVRGPASSVFFASSGSRMLKLKQTDEKTTIIERITSTVRLRRAYDEALTCPAPERRPAAVDERVELADPHRQQARRAPRGS